MRCNSMWSGILIEEASRSGVEPDTADVADHEDVGAELMESNAAIHVADGVPCEKGDAPVRTGFDVAEAIEHAPLRQGIARACDDVRRAIGSK